MTVSRQIHRKAYNTNILLRLHLHEFIVPIGTARLAPPSLADELLHSEEDEDTSGTAGAERAERSGSHTGEKLMRPFWESTTYPSQRGADGVYSGITIRITSLNIRLVQAGGLEAYL